MNENSYLDTGTLGIVDRLIYLFLFAVPLILYVIIYFYSHSVEGYLMPNFIPLLKLFSLPATVIAFVIAYFLAHGVDETSKLKKYFTIQMAMLLVVIEVVSIIINILSWMTRPPHSFGPIVAIIGLPILLFGSFISLLYIFLLIYFFAKGRFEIVIIKNFAKRFV